MTWMGGGRVNMCMPLRLPPSASASSPAATSTRRSPIPRCHRHLPRSLSRGNATPPSSLFPLYRCPLLLWRRGRCAANFCCSHSACGVVKEACLPFTAKKRKEDSAEHGWISTNLSAFISTGAHCLPAMPLLRSPAKVAHACTVVGDCLSPPPQAFARHVFCTWGERRFTLSLHGGPLFLTLGSWTFFHCPTPVLPLLLLALHSCLSPV
jgi:hypothetical protein